MNEGAFELPEIGLVDRTVHLLEAPLPGGGALGLSIARAPIPPGRTLRELASAYLLGEAERRSGYAVLEERDGERAGAPAIDVCARFRQDGSVTYQRQAHLCASSTWILFEMTAPLAEREACDEHMERVLATLKLRDHA